MRLRSLSLVLATATAAGALVLSATGTSRREPIVPAVNALAAGTGFGNARFYSAPSLGLSDATPDERLARLHALLEEAIGEGGEREREAQVYQELARLILQHPEVLPSLEAELLEAQEGSSFARLTLAALAGSEREDAQASLVRVVEARLDDVLFVEQGVTVMGFANRPTPAILEGLDRLCKHERPEIRDMALLAMGGAGGELSKSQPARAAAVARELGSGLANASDTSTRALHLGALGNVGTPEAVALILPYASSEDPQLRAKAITSLRMSPTAESEAVIERALISDADPRVRKAAAWTLGRRPPSDAILATLGRVVTAEPAVDAALAMLETLWRRREGREAAVRAVLAEVAGQHAVSEVRERAQRMLRQFGETSG